MNLETLLAGMPKSKFLADFFLRLPLAMPATAAAFCQLGSWERLAGMLSQPSVDVLVARAGRRFEGPVPTTRAEADSLLDQGCTILVRHAEAHDHDLRLVADAFENDFFAPVNVHWYATPTGAHGFGWHYDAEEVFVVQTAGCKHYSLRKNTVQPWPLEETIPADMGYQHEIMPLVEVTLAAGDWLYIPSGWWHKAETLQSDDHALSLAIGVSPPAAIAVYDFLRSRLLQSLLWRQRLPIAGRVACATDEEVSQQHRAVFSQLADDLSRTLRDDEVVNQWLEKVRQDNKPTRT